MSELPPPNPEESAFQLPSPEAAPHALVYEPTVEELQNGFVLLPEEKVAFDITPDRSAARRSFETPNGVRIEGTAVAEMRLGGEQTYATGLVINTFDAPDRQESSLLITSPSETFAIPLKKGELQGIGRSYDRQDRLPDTVSGDHCAVGLDENGRFIIENHNPTNATSARRLGKFAR